MLWRDGIFDLSDSTLGSLIDRARRFDFAVLVFTPDDAIYQGDAVQKAARDNVVFELGLFMGILGRERAFFVFNEDDRPKMPSDLLGVTAATFRHRQDGNLQAAVRPACTRIIGALRTLGIRSCQLDLTLQKLGDNARSGYRIRHISFQNAVTFHCSDWASVSSSWAEGTLRVDKRYQTLLSEVYEFAKKSIFSTSIPLYRDMWKSESGRRILKTQQGNSKAKSTRVFVFDTRGDVTDEDERIFAQHHRHGIEVLLFFDDAWSLRFPASIGNDWTLVDDGDVIGVTLATGTTYEAEWYFGNMEKAQQFIIVCDQLRRSSETYRP